MTFLSTRGALTRTETEPRQMAFVPLFALLYLKTSAEMLTAMSTSATYRNRRESLSFFRATRGLLVVQKVFVNDIIISKTTRYLGYFFPDSSELFRRNNKKVQFSGQRSENLGSFGTVKFAYFYTRLRILFALPLQLPGLNV